MAVNQNADEYAAGGRTDIFFPGIPADLTGQCTMLIKWYIGEMCGVANWQAARGHARDIGDTLVREGLAFVVAGSDRRRGDIVVWKKDGATLDDGTMSGHIGVLLSGDRVFEENVAISGTRSAVYGGNRVYASRIDPLYASWRRGAATFYRMVNYSEVVYATDDQIRKAYIEILERPVDGDGLAHYRTKTNQFMRKDLMNSAERKRLEANKAAKDAEQARIDAENAVKQAEVAKKEADRIAKEEAVRKAQEAAEAAKIEQARAEAKAAAAKAEEARRAKEQAELELKKKEEQKAMSLSTEDQAKLKSVSDEAVAALEVAVASDEGQDIIKAIPQKVKVAVYIVGDVLIGGGILVPQAAIVFGWTDVVRIVALSGLLATAGTFVLTMFGIYKAGKK